MAQKFYPGLGSLPTTLETSPPGRASPQTREAGLAALREEFTPRPIVDALGPMGRLMLGLPLYTSPDQKILEQRRQMDEVMASVPPPEGGNPDDPRGYAAYMYGLSKDRPQLGPSASGRAVPTPTDTQMMSSIVGGPIAGPAMALGAGAPTRGLPLGVEAGTDQNPVWFPPDMTFHGFKTPVLPGMTPDPGMPTYPFDMDVNR